MARRLRSLVVWFLARYPAGLGRTEEALSLLGRARQEFARREMWYSVALADLEIAVLLLAENRTAEVQEMARELVKVFEEKGVHREALAALRLFQEAAEREEARPSWPGGFCGICSGRGMTRSCDSRAHEAPVARERLPVDRETLPVR